MSKWIKELIIESVRRFFILRLGVLARSRPGSRTVYVVDIDNTLAHTWPSLCDGYIRTEASRYETLSIFRGMRQLVVEQAAAGHLVVFVSARSYHCYFSTMRWLRACGVPFDQLILVYRVSEKIGFIDLLIAKGLNVVYIDDLSYNHEAGEVRFYEETIRRVRNMPIRYFGLAEIEAINDSIART
ncbi:hypothetical protein C7T94_11715 [Pedobacter yulinensis]|uniref:Magnesium-dependent phosphatase-1 n=1 Tax=Pedobacter yulinensis TaxID=2126353 RepID=A0A2T3HLD1_9SPHI|nr:hypothetical protein [Pedobacter yulinensis]PST83252.1 hypothetical protein C7T94_11715 [Pedobacter yulinensis]